MMIRLAHMLKWVRSTALVVTLVLLFDGPAPAQVVSVDAAAAPIGAVDPRVVEVQREAFDRSAAAHRRTEPIRDSLDRIDYGVLAVPRGTAPAQATASSRRSTARKVLGGAVGAVGGFFAGGYLGAAIEGDCGGCDDPGLKGALIGAPIGAVTGGILGALFLF